MEYCLCLPDEERWVDPYGLVCLLTGDATPHDGGVGVDGGLAQDRRVHRHRAGVQERGGAAVQPGIALRQADGRLHEVLLLLLDELGRLLLDGGSLQQHLLPRLVLQLLLPRDLGQEGIFTELGEEGGRPGPALQFHPLDADVLLDMECNVVQCSAVQCSAVQCSRLYLDQVLA